MSVLIWVQTVFKGDQQTKKVAAGEEKVKEVVKCSFINFLRFDL